jgi:hypothetical protein
MPAAAVTMAEEFIQSLARARREEEEALEEAAEEEAAEEEAASERA